MEDRRDDGVSAEITFRDRLSVRAKMMVVGLAVTLATAATGWVSYRAERNTADRGLFLYDHILQSINYARAAQRDFELLRNFGRATARIAADDTAAAFLGELSRDAGVTNPAAAVRYLVRESVENLRVAAERDLPPSLTTRAGQLIDGVQRFEQPLLGRLAGAGDPPVAGLLQEMALLAEELELFVQDLAAEGFRVREEMGRQVARAAWSIAIAVAAAILVAVLVSLLLGEIVARQIHFAAEYSDSVASGSLDRVVVVRGNTAMASLMRSLDRMRASIRDQILQIEDLRQRADRLLDSMLPSSVAARLRRGEEQIADARVEATVVFLDLVGFTELSRRFGAAHLIETLDSIFRRLDEIAERHQLEKIKTIGDAYLAAAGVTEDTRPDDAARCAAFLLEAREIVRDIGTELGYPLDVRGGLHNGPLVAGILGKSKPFFDIWGDSVNLASRLQGSAQAGELRVSESAYWRLRGAFELSPLGAVDLKGIGPTAAFALERVHLQQTPSRPQST